MASSRELLLLDCKATGSLRKNFRWSRFAHESLLKMAQGQENIELEVFCQHSSSFADAISEVTPMADKLHEKSLIDIAEEAREAYESRKREGTNPPNTTQEVMMTEANTPPDYLGILLLGRRGFGKSTTGNKLLKAGGESMFLEDKIEEFDAGDGVESCTSKIACVFRRGTGKAKAVQVIDTPGFANFSTSTSVEIKKANLAILRDLMRKLINDKLRIHRVLYFLPYRELLKVTYTDLQEEIEVMHHYFGNAIFDRMVLVATLHKQKQFYGFDKADREGTRKVFQRALTLASIGDDRPKCPPVIFVGFHDTGVDILRRIESTHAVSNEVLTLQKFLQSTCSRCSAKYISCWDKDPVDPDNLIGVLIQVNGAEQEPNKEECTPYHSSQCHPLFMPKPSFWARPVGTRNNEICVNCQQSPRSDGCCEVGTRYKATLATGQTEVVIVDHAYRNEHYFSK